MAVRRIVDEPTPVLVHHYPRVRLWREDLVELVKLVEDAFPGGAQLRADDYALDGVDDIAALPGARIRSFDVISNAVDGPRLKLTEFSFRLEIPNPGYTGRGLADVLQQFAREHRQFVLSPQPFLVAVAVASLASIYLHLSPRAAALLRGTQITVLLALAIASYRANSRGQPFLVSSGAAMFTNTRAEAPTFIERVKDDIVVNAAGVCAGWLLGILTPWASRQLR